MIHAKNSDELAKSVIRRFMGVNDLSWKTLAETLTQAGFETTEGALKQANYNNNLRLSLLMEIIVTFDVSDHLILELLGSERLKKQISGQLKQV